MLDRQPHPPDETPDRRSKAVVKTTTECHRVPSSGGPPRTRPGRRGPLVAVHTPGSRGSPDRGIALGDAERPELGLPMDPGPLRPPPSSPAAGQSRPGRRGADRRAGQPSPTARPAPAGTAAGSRPPRPPPCPARPARASPRPGRRRSRRRDRRRRRATAVDGVRRSTVSVDMRHLVAQRGQPVGQRVQVGLAAGQLRLDGHHVADRGGLGQQRPHPGHAGLLAGHPGVEVHDLGGAVDDLARARGHPADGGDVVDHPVQRRPPAPAAPASRPRSLVCSSTTRPPAAVAVVRTCRVAAADVRRRPR